MKKKPNMSFQAKERRRRVITRIEEQLKRGTKIAKRSTAALNNEPGIPFTEKDIERLNKDLKILKSRI
jgi:hypothetical protein